MSSSHQATYFWHITPHTYVDVDWQWGTLVNHSRVALSLLCRTQWQADRFFHGCCAWWFIHQSISFPPALTHFLWQSHFLRWKAPLSWFVKARWPALCMVWNKRWILSISVPLETVCNGNNIFNKPYSVSANVPVTLQVWQAKAIAGCGSCISYSSHLPSSINERLGLWFSSHVFFPIAM